VPPGNAICDSADEVLPAVHGAGSSRSQEVPTLRISVHRLTWYCVGSIHDVGKRRHGTERSRFGQVGFIDSTGLRSRSS